MTRNLLATEVRTPEHLEPLSNRSYRADIDGLRAFAVLSVVGYHAFGDWVRGGFIGVDVFFVISGYLICGILFAKAASGTLSFRDFYARRITRIFPALSVTLLLCLAAGWVYQFPDEFRELRRHVTAGALFYANYTLHDEAGYWDRASEFKPLLHLWSLAVEEQFYILFPLLVFAASKARANLLLMTLAIIAVSFAANVTRVSSYPLDSFYSPLRRFWELLLGGLIAQVQLADVPRRWATPGLSRWRQRWGPTASNVCSVVGFVTLVGGVVLMNKRLLFPGYWALVPTLGAVLIISSGRDAWLNRVVLSHKVCVWFGLVSYPLYLWHWPVLSFLRILRGGEAEIIERMLAVLVSVFLAWLTYRFVERPIRSYPHRFRAALALVPVLLTTVVIARSQELIPTRRFGDQFAKFIEHPAIPRWTPVDGLRMSSGDRRTAIFIGDSHANQYEPRIARLVSSAPDRTRSAIFFGYGSCLPIPHVKRASEPERACEDEVSLRHALAALAANQDIDTVVLSAFWSNQLTYPDLRYQDAGVNELITEQGAMERVFSSLEGMIASMRREGRRVIVVLDNPNDTRLAVVNPRLLLYRHFSGSLSLRDNVLTRQDVLRSHEPARTWLVRAALRSGATIVDPLDFLCDAAVCPVLTEQGEPMYYDGNHLRASYVQDRVTYLDDVMHLDADDGPSANVSSASSGSH